MNFNSCFGDSPLILGTLIVLITKNSIANFEFLSFLVPKPNRQIVEKETRKKNKRNHTPSSINFYVGFETINNTQIIVVMFT